MKLKTQLFGHTYEFKSIRELMAKANEEKSGDKLAGIAASSAEERVAAKAVLAEVTLAELRNSPAVPYEEDEVTRINQDAVNERIFDEHKNQTVGEFREWLLAEETTSDMIKLSDKEEKSLQVIFSEVFEGMAKVELGFSGKFQEPNSKAVMMADDIAAQANGMMVKEEK